MRLDNRTVDRLLDGTMSRDDAPPRYRQVALAIDALTAPASDAELAGEANAVAAIATLASYRPPEKSTAVRSMRPAPVRAPRRVLRLATVSFVGALTLFGGLAAANALPSGIQRVASDVLDEVGVSVPAPESHATHEPSVNLPAGFGNPSSQSGGSDVSKTANSTHATGGDHGATVSAEASDGKSHAGEPGPSSSSQGPPEQSNAGGNAGNPNVNQPSTTTEAPKGKPDK